MEFNKKLQELRKSKGLTQDQLAERLYVSRTAISKWESGRGYPSLDSLKAIAQFFSITIDELLSSNEILIIAQETNKAKETSFQSLIYGLLDIGMALLLFLPFFAEKYADGKIHEVSLLALTYLPKYVSIAYYVMVTFLILLGVCILSFRGCNGNILIGFLNKLSLVLNVAATTMFIITQQPYAAIFVLFSLIVKVMALIKVK